MGKRVRSPLPLSLLKGSKAGGAVVGIIEFPQCTHSRRFGYREEWVRVEEVVQSGGAQLHFLGVLYTKRIMSEKNNFLV